MADPSDNEQEQPSIDASNAEPEENHRDEMADPSDNEQEQPDLGASNAEPEENVEVNTAEASTGPSDEVVGDDANVPAVEGDGSSKTVNAEAKNGPGSLAFLEQVVTEIPEISKSLGNDIVKKFLESDESKLEEVAAAINEGLRNLIEKRVPTYNLPPAPAYDKNKPIGPYNWPKVGRDFEWKEDKDNKKATEENYKALYESNVFYEKCSAKAEENVLARPASDAVWRGNNWKELSAYWKGLEIFIVALHSDEEFTGTSADSFKETYTNTLENRKQGTGAWPYDKESGKGKKKKESTPNQEASGQGSSNKETSGQGSSNKETATPVRRKRRSTLMSNSDAGKSRASSRPSRRQRGNSTRDDPELEDAKMEGTNATEEQKVEDGAGKESDEPEAEDTTMTG